MEFLSALWMPMIVSAVAVFFASFLAHMVLPHHKSEFRKLPDEDKMLAAAAGIAAERYMFPFPDNAQSMSSPEFIEKTKNSPNGLLIVYPGPVNMGQNLILTFSFYILVSIFVGYIGWHAIGADSTLMFRLRICGAVAFAAHGLGWMSFFIWFRYGRFWPNFFDSLIYAVITGLIFAWMWPAQTV